MTDLIKAYCMEFNKKESDIDLFIKTLLNPLGMYLHLQYCIDYIMQYYANKYTIHTLYQPNNIMNNNTNNIVLIY